MKLTFGKREKLKSRKSIEALFTDGHSLSEYPIRATYRIIESSPKDEKAKVAVSVSKRKFKHAVDRNHLKRRMKEAYRLNKETLSLDDKKRIEILFIYLSSEKKSFQIIEKSICKLLEKLSKCDH